MGNTEMHIIYDKDIDEKLEKQVLNKLNRLL
jgi:hypothetical protein